jgi:hypothetical protein
MTNCSKQEKIDYLKNMPETITIKDKLKYIEMVMLPRWYPFKNYKGGEVSTTMYLDILHLYERFTDPEKFDFFEVTRLEELEKLKKIHWKECKHCKQLREPEHFVSCYKTCLLCLDMTPEEALEKFEKKKLAMDSGLKCSSCCTRKLLNEFDMKPDGTFKKTCISCVKKKKKAPEVTPEA